MKPNVLYQVIICIFFIVSVFVSAQLYWSLNQIKKFEQEVLLLKNQNAQLVDEIQILKKSVLNSPSVENLQEATFSSSLFTDWLDVILLGGSSLCVGLAICIIVQNLLGGGASPGFSASGVDTANFSKNAIDVISKVNSDSSVVLNSVTEKSLPDCVPYFTQLNQTLQECITLALGDPSNLSLISVHPSLENLCHVNIIVNDPALLKIIEIKLKFAGLI